MRMMSALLAATALCVTPAEAVRAALADLETLEPSYRAQMRYLVVERDDQVVAVRYLINAVSRSRAVYRPVVTANGTLVRLDLATLANLRDAKTYREVLEAWETLAADDPYFGLRTQVLLSANKGSRVVRVDGGWVGLTQASRLRAATGSVAAVLRADYFVGRVAGQDYYVWAGIPNTEGEFLRSLGIDRQQVERLAADTAANLFRSQVTHKPRRIVHLPGPLGSTWLTQDVATEDPGRDPIRNPVDFRQQRFTFDASEWFAQKANKFWLTVLFDSQGRRQFSVPEQIAKDAAGLDGIVRPLISCVRCHELHGGRAGLQPFVDDQYPLLSGEAAVLRSLAPEVAQRIGERYDPRRQQRYLQRDREDYVDAVEQACGTDPQTATQSLSEVFASYVYEPVSLVRAASEAGISKEQFVTLTVDSNDPIVLALRSAKQVNRKAYEASFQEIMLRTQKP